MEFFRDNNVAAQGHGIEGAIFMSNRKTKRECLRRNLFGLPESQASIVKQVKTGMMLFLFEYEERKLYGLFEASSDGAVNVDPHAFSSMGKSFSAQIRFRKLWSCHPLSEPEFRNAIRDNYYSHNKFSFLLSKEQVLKLIRLFASKKINSKKSLSLGPENKTNKHPKCVRLNANTKGRIPTSDSVTNVVNIKKDVEPVSCSGYPDLPRPNASSSQCVNTSFFGTEHTASKEQILPFKLLHSKPEVPQFIPSLSHRDGTVMGDFYDKTSTPHEDNLPYHCMAPDSQYSETHFSSADFYSSPQKLSGYGKNSAEALYPYSRIHSYQSSMEPDNMNSFSTESLIRDAPINSKDYIALPASECYDPDMPCITLPGSRYFEQKDFNSTNLDCYKSFPVTEKYQFSTSPTIPPNLTESYASEGHRDWTYEHLASIPFPSEAENLRKRDIDHPSRYFSHLSQDKDYHYHHLRESHLDEYDGTTSEYSVQSGTSKRFSAFSRMSQDNDYNQHVESHSDEYCETTSNYTLQSDRSKRPSVFSRLYRAPEVQRDENDEDVEGGQSTLDLSVSELMDILAQRRKKWKLMNKLKTLSACDVSRRHGCPTEIGIVGGGVMDEEAELASSDEARESIEIPFLNFKRRSQIQKLRTRNEAGGREVTNQESMGKNKRRKLVRPSFDMGINKRRKLVRPSFDKKDTSIEGICNDQNFEGLPQETIKGLGSVIQEVSSEKPATSRGRGSVILEVDTKNSEETNRRHEEFQSSVISETSKISNIPIGNEGQGGEGKSPEEFDSTCRQTQELNNVQKSFMNADGKRNPELQAQKSDADSETTKIINILVGKECLEGKGKPAEEFDNNNTCRLTQEKHNDIQKSLICVDGKQNLEMPSHKSEVKMPSHKSEVKMPSHKSEVKMPSAGKSKESTNMYPEEMAKEIVALEHHNGQRKQLSQESHTHWASVGNVGEGYTPNSSQKFTGEISLPSDSRENKMLSTVFHLDSSVDNVQEGEKELTPLVSHKYFVEETGKRNKKSPVKDGADVEGVALDYISLELESSVHT